MGIEATGGTAWFERLLAELGHELWVGDPAAIRAGAGRRQKTDRRDAEPLLELLLTNRFPRRWIPSPEERDFRQLLKHRQKLGGMRTSVKNQLHYLAMSQGWAASGSCGARAGGGSWKVGSWVRGRAGGGKSCWRYWTSLRPGSKNSTRR